MQRKIDYFEILRHMYFGKLRTAYDGNVSNENIANELCAGQFNMGVEYVVVNGPDKEDEYIFRNLSLGFKNKTHMGCVFSDHPAAMESFKAELMATIPEVRALIENHRLISYSQISNFENRTESEDNILRLKAGGRYQAVVEFYDTIISTMKENGCDEHQKRFIL